MSLKQIAKNIADTTKDAVGNLVNDLYNVGYQASIYYTHPYIASVPGQGAGVTSPLENIGLCMRRAYWNVMCYNNFIPYANVEIESPGRLSKDNARPIKTNDVMKSMIDNEEAGIRSHFNIE